MILDTTFVLDLLAGDEGATLKAEELENNGVAMKLPAMTVTELYIGIGTGVADEEEERQIRRIIEGLSFVGGFDPHFLHNPRESASISTD